MSAYDNVPPSIIALYSISVSIYNRVWTSNKEIIIGVHCKLMKKCASVEGRLHLILNIGTDSEKSSP
jgi:hypothetical protein